MTISEVIKMKMTKEIIKRCIEVHFDIVTGQFPGFLSFYLVGGSLVEFQGFFYFDEEKWELLPVVGFWALGQEDRTSQLSTKEATNIILRRNIEKIEFSYDVVNCPDLGFTELKSLEGFLANPREFLPQYIELEKTLDESEG